MRDINVDMTRGEITSQPVPPDNLLGGRAIIDRYLTEHVSPGVHPLSEDAVLIVSPGFFAGTAAPSSGRVSIGGKSPLTGGIKEANAGGPAGHKLGRLGIRSIVVQGRAKEWQVLRLTPDGISLEPAGEVVGLENYAAAARLRERYGKDVALLIAGPAGERGYANATVAATDLEGRPARHAARGGLGSVMGAKRLKAIVMDDAGCASRKAADPEGFKKAVKASSEYLRNAVIVSLMHQQGTDFWYQVEYERGACVSLNHHAGTMEGAERMNPESFVRWQEAHGGTHGQRCLPGCVVACSNIVHDSKGEYLTSSFEFETMALCGTNLGLADIEQVATIDRRCDELGLDTIEFGNTIGMLTDAGLYELGDFSRVQALLNEVTQDTVLGKVIGSGTEIAARVFGVSRVPTVKGQGIPGHAARASKGWGVTYATSPQGADHTTGAVIKDPFDPRLQVDRSRWSQIINTAMDATGLCHFTFPLLADLELVMEMIRTLFGVDYEVADIIALGKEMLNQERDFNKRAGISEFADRLPDWMRKEPLAPTNSVFDVPQEEIGELFDFSKTTEFMETS